MQRRPSCATAARHSQLYDCVQAERGGALSAQLWSALARCECWRMRCERRAAAPPFHPTARLTKRSLAQPTPYQLKVKVLHWTKRDCTRWNRAPSTIVLSVCGSTCAAGQQVLIFRSGFLYAAGDRTVLSEAGWRSSTTRVRSRQGGLLGCTPYPQDGHLPEFAEQTGACATPCAFVLFSALLYLPSTCSLKVVQFLSAHCSLPNAFPQPACASLPGALPYGCPAFPARQRCLRHSRLLRRTLDCLAHLRKGVLGRRRCCRGHHA